MPFESPAIVELMGHQKIAGKVTEEVIAGVAMLRVDVPKTDDYEEYTKFYAANALYCITPTDEKTMLAAVRALCKPPVSPWVVNFPETPLLAEKTVTDDPIEFWDNGDDAIEAMIAEADTVTDQLVDRLQQE